MPLRKLTDGSSHSHLNLNTLTKFSEADSKLYWDGLEIALGTANGLPDTANVIAYFDSSNSAKKVIDTSGGTSTISLLQDSINNYILTQTTKSIQPLHISNSMNGMDVIRFNMFNSQKLESNIGTILNNSNFPTNEASLILAGRFYETLNPGYSYGLMRTGNSGSGFWKWGGDGKGYMDEFRNTRIEQYPSSMPVSAGNYIFSIRSGIGAGNYEMRINKISQGTQTPSWGIRSQLAIGTDSTGNYATFDFLGLVIRKNSNAQSIIDTENFLNSKWAMGL